MEAIRVRGEVVRVRQVGMEESTLSPGSGRWSEIPYPYTNRPEGKERVREGVRDG